MCYYQVMTEGETQIQRKWKIGMETLQVLKEVGFNHLFTGRKHDRKDAMKHGYLLWP